MNGLHIISNFYGCKFDFSKEEQLMEQVAQMCKDVGLTVVGTSQHKFEPQGITFTVLLAESHVSLHSWPEVGNVAFDIYTCNFFKDNTEKTEMVYYMLKDLLQPNHEHTVKVDRESLRAK